MAEEEHVKIIRKGVKAWNEWKRAHDTHPQELDNAILKIQKALNLKIEVAIETDLSGVNLNREDLSGVNFSYTDLRRAHLQRANLRGANLIGADFSRAQLNGSDFTDATIGYTTFANVDFSEVKGLETVRHQGPSSLGIDTVYSCQGKIPEIFLRGVGVGDDFITVIEALSGAAQFFSCFISYSTQDQAFATQLYADLQAKGVRCWFAPHDVQSGKKLYEQIDTAIRMHERLLLILSPDSMNSEWVKTEIAKARERETKENRRMLFPVRLRITFKEMQAWECFDADTGKDSAREIREYYLPDFSNWRNLDSYQEEFGKLLRDLKKA
ncbi:MAG TPA: toll/interleukin-1 receptor domain-containing protein [Pyrinomonadaceae bacterium]|nr:toll/interleukin-1 receptor domain-containing protein [Pyrinomonadaceae bacterium]